MPSSRWVPTTLGECATLVSGGTPSKSILRYWDGEIPWVSAKDMKLFRLHDAQDHITSEGVDSGSTLAPLGSTLLLVRGMTLHQRVPVCLITRPMAFNQDVKALVGKQGVEQGFLAYWLAANEDLLLNRVDSASHGTGRILTEALKSLPLTLPPLSEQRRIVDLLASLDDKIEVNREMNKTLEAIARAVFKSRFFERTFSVRPMIKVGEVAEIIKGRSYKSEELVETGDTALVTLKSFERGGGYKIDGLKGFSGSFKPEQEVKPGEIVVALTDVTQNAEVIGRPALVRGSEKFSKLVASLDTAIVRPRKVVGSQFLYCLFRTPEFADHTYAHCSGTTVLHLGREAIPSFGFPKPEEREASRFEQIVTPMFDRINHNEIENTNLAAIRHSILPTLMSGKIRIKQAEKIVEARA